MSIIALTPFETAKAMLIYQRTRNLQAVQIPLGHNNLKSIVRYLGIEVENAFEEGVRTKV